MTEKELRIFLDRRNKTNNVQISEKEIRDHKKIKMFLDGLEKTEFYQLSPKEIKESRSKKLKVPMGSPSKKYKIEDIKDKFDEIIDQIYKPTIFFTFIFKMSDLLKATCLPHYEEAVEVIRCRWFQSETMDDVYVFRWDRDSETGMRIDCDWDDVRDCMEYFAENMTMKEFPFMLARCADNACLWDMKVWGGFTIRSDKGD